MFDFIVENYAVVHLVVLMTFCLLFSSNSEIIIAIVDRCASSPCMNGGTCSNGENSFMCECGEFEGQLYGGETCNERKYAAFAYIYLLHIILHNNKNALLHSLNYVVLHLFFFLNSGSCRDSSSNHSASRKQL